MGNQTSVLIPSKLENVSSGGLLNSVLLAMKNPALLTGDEATLVSFAPLVERVFLHDHEEPRRALIDIARKNRRIADLLLARTFPDVARFLDTGWSQDRLSFVDVTIAATRLQDAVRVLGHFQLPHRDVASALMIVPTWEQHSLPATFAAQNMRKLGVPTQLVSGMSVPEILTFSQRTGPASLMISVGTMRSLAMLPEMIKALRRGIPRAIPIVVGGPVLAYDEVGCRRAGADLATNNLNDALSFCDFELAGPIHTRGLPNV